MISVLVLILVAIVALIVYLVMSGRAGSPKSAGTRMPAPKPAPDAKKYTVDDEEEATQVRVIGPRLVRTVGGLKVGDEIVIAGGIRVGRGQECTLRLHDPELSSVHADIRIEGGVPVVIDLGSSNGTFVNNQRTEPQVPTPSRTATRLRSEPKISSSKIRSSGSQ